MCGRYFSDVILVFHNHSNKQISSYWVVIQAAARIFVVVLINAVV